MIKMQMLVTPLAFLDFAAVGVNLYSSFPTNSRMQNDRTTREKVLCFCEIMDILDLLLRL